MMEEDVERDLHEKNWDLKDSRAFVHIAQFHRIKNRDMKLHAFFFVPC